MGFDEQSVFQLDYDIAPRDVQVKVGGESFVLKEASGGAVTRYRNEQLKYTKLDPETGKPVSVEGIVSTEPLLVSLCLFKVGPDGTTTNTNVPLSQILSWPNRVQKNLFETVKKISGIDEEEDTTESLQKQKDEIEKKMETLQQKGTLSKNLPSATLDGSD